ncbi:MAG: T9SS type A sorting domain-containing protein [Flavobacteriales bacterium]|nr:T9SS type A sorting domain-containing protein [Flavobacteriales bacterium]
MRSLALVVLMLVGMDLCSQLYTSAADGPWSSPSTWTCNCVPSVADSVEIAHAVTIQASVTLTNAWVHITPNGWFGFSSMGFLAITQPVLNEGTLYIIGDLDVDWPFDSPGYIEVNGDFANDDSINIGAAGLIRVNGGLMNDGIIVGNGAICVSGITINNGDLVGSMDFCDASPTTLVPPIIDQNYGTVDPAIVFCESGKCTVGIGEETLSGISIAPNPSRGPLQLTGLPEGDLRIELFDALGRPHQLSAQGSGRMRSLDLGSLPLGAYVLRVCASEGCRTFRVVRE